MQSTAVLYDCFSCWIELYDTISSRFRFIYCAEGFSANSLKIRGFIQATLSKILETNPLWGINVRTKCVNLPQQHGAPKSRNITKLYLHMAQNHCLFMLKYKEWLFAGTYRNPHLSDSTEHLLVVFNNNLDAMSASINSCQLSVRSTRLNTRKCDAFIALSEWHVHRKRQGTEQMWTYLSHFGIFTHKGLIRTGELRWELVNVQHVDSDGHPTGQNWTIWRRKHNTEYVKHKCALRTG